MMILCRLGSMSFMMASMAGMFPIGSIKKKSMADADNMEPTTSFIKVVF
jgi:hypothetical protein